MGEVYRAKDTKLGRQVAVKILPDGFVKDPARVARFPREAQALAALNHQDIAQIYGFEDSSQIHALRSRIAFSGSPCARRGASNSASDC